MWTNQIKEEKKRNISSQKLCTNIENQTILYFVKGPKANCMSDKQSISFGQKATFRSMK